MKRTRVRKNLGREMGRVYFAIATLRPCNVTLQINLQSGALCGWILLDNVLYLLSIFSFSSFCPKVLLQEIAKVAVQFPTVFAYLVHRVEGSVLVSFKKDLRININLKRVMVGVWLVASRRSEFEPWHI